jgi:hypothetical protein
MTAASDTFPAGWTETFIAIAPATDPTIIIPAVAGITHVLDGATAKALFNVVAALTFVFEIFDGAAGGALLGEDQEVAQNVGAAGPYTEIDMTLTGPFIGTPGNAMTIVCHSSVNADCYFAIAAQGHDL